MDVFISHQKGIWVIYKFSSNYGPPKLIYLLFNLNVFNMESRVLLETLIHKARREKKDSNLNVVFTLGL